MLWSVSIRGGAGTVCVGVGRAGGGFTFVAGH
jgi:hypothetical protein